MDREQYGRALGAALREARRVRRLTQVDTAALVGVSQPTMARWEAGATQPEAWELRRLATVLGFGGLDELDARAARWARARPARDLE